MRKLLLIAALAMVFPISSQAKTLDDLLVEKGVVSEEGRASNHGSKVYWNKGTRLEFPDTGFSTNVFTEIRTRYEFFDASDKTDESNSSNVDVRNARIGVSGHMLNREFTYFVKAALTSEQAVENDLIENAGLLDAYITWAPCDMGSVTLGQFKSAISRQYNTALVNLQLPDRSVVSDHFTLGRHQGAAFALDAIDGVSIVGQVLNGEGINGVGDNTDHVYAVAVRVPLAGEIDSFSESDVEHTQDLAADIGAAYAYIKEGDLDHSVISADLNVKSNGLSANLEYFQGNQDVAGGSSITDRGGYAQAGYFLTPKELEIAARYGYLDCETGEGLCMGDGSKVNEASVALNYYWWKHHLKGQVGYSYINQDAGGGAEDINSNRWLLQLSGWF